MPWWAWLVIGIIVGLFAAAVIASWIADSIDEHAEKVDGAVEFAENIYGQKVVVKCKGEGGMRVQRYQGDTFFWDDVPWEDVIDKFPSHKEEAKARLEARK